jgi:hypothetical protein
MNSELDRTFIDEEDPNAVPSSPDELAEAWGNATFPPAVLTSEQNAEMMRSAPAIQMNAIEVIKHACVDALELDQLSPGDAVAYASLVDPVSVLGLVDIVENRVTDEEIAALHQVINAMSDYIRSNAPSTTAEPLLQHARILVGMTSEH